MQILPNAKSQFIDSAGQPLASGTVGFYFPGTLNPKPTFQDAAGTIANTNPVALDSRGQALIWGSGVYRQIVKDASGVTIWDQVTEDSNSGLIGNMTDSRWVVGASYTDPVGNTPGTFVPGTTTVFNLPSPPGAVANTWLFFDLGYQADDQVQSVSGTTFTLASPVPNGIQEVTIKTGSTIAIGTPGSGTITDDSVASNAGINSSKLSFTQRGVGAIARTVLSRLQDSVSVFDFMTPTQIADVQTFSGTIDVSAAIQTAIGSGATRIHCPAGLYLIRTALNFTNRSSKPMIISGDGSYFQQNTGTTFLFKTGTWMADMTGCQFLHLEHMRWYSDGSAGSSIMGVLYARSTTVNYAMYNTMLKMIIELPSSNGSASGSVALANNCAENFQCDQCWFVADTPYVGSLGNEVGFASIYTTVANTIWSNTDKTFRQCIFQARNGFANVFYGEADSTFDQCNWTLLGALGAGVLAAMMFNASADGYQKCSNLRFTGDFESFPSIAYLASNTQNLDIDCTTANTTYSFIQPYTATVHDGFRLKVNQLSGSQTNLVLSTGAGVQMNNAQIFMASGQTLLDGNLNIQGGLILGGANDLSNSSVLSINGASSFRASYVNSTLRASAGWNPGGITTAGTVFTNIAVPGAVVGSSVKIIPPYSLQVCIASASVSAPGNVLLSLSNITGGTVTFGSGTWQVEVNKLYA